MIRIKQARKHNWLTKLGRLKLLMEKRYGKVDRNKNDETLFSFCAFIYETFEGGGLYRKYTDRDKVVIIQNGIYSFNVCITYFWLVKTHRACLDFCKHNFFATNFNSCVTS